MFECAIQFMTEFVNIIPMGIVLILIFNIISDLLFRG